MTTRKRRKATPRVQCRRVPWADPYPEIFRLGTAAGLTPPSNVLIRSGSRTISFVADFTNGDGMPVRATVRIDRSTLAVLDENMAARFVMKAKAA
ncbi:hypothetical protein [Brevundimonas sp. SPF441]|uniref:hypothetical protein n=1 Tax=Brevundimonas sp. SPF441 TaxID=2663795 RepID=UPI00129E4A28|nr:hypothetical protein [Brevundimonas sp. SPF441]MRL67856.1 hypothetical protein [Brevundimonas sp. SPF441]